MSKVFKVEEGNVLRLVMEKPMAYEFGYDFFDNWKAAFEKWENRESYPYVSQDWRVGDLVPESEFELKEDDPHRIYSAGKLIAIPISKPTKP